ncbi:MAG: S1-like domain-containing RNA-binding protein, partial [Bacteroidota bacterium]
MIIIGEYNLLTIDRIVSPGAFLVDEEGNDILLPNKYLPSNPVIGDKINVFVYNDSEDRIIATTLTPKITLNEFAFLRVKDINRIGAFMDWGLEKDLLVPFSEQNQKMQIDRWYVIRLLLDTKTNRLLGSNKLSKFLEAEYISVEVGEEVDLIVTEKTDIGFQVIINHAHRGLVYDSEIFRELNIGDVLKGYVKLIREDGKIDIILQKIGFENIEPSGQQILEQLKQSSGYLQLSDKSAPEAIYSVLKMSKKTFKKAIGGLYK